jgi:hypothetical protein
MKSTYTTYTTYTTCTTCTALTPATCRLFWVREDKQAELNMGDYATVAEAVAEIPACLQEILSQCDDEGAVTLAGYWSVEQLAADGSSIGSTKYAMPALT